MNIANCPADGITDATACLQDAINNTPAWGELLLPAAGQTYAISRPLVLAQPIRLLGERITVRQITPGNGGIQVTSSNVRISDLTLLGPQYLTQAPGEQGITIAGPSAAEMIGEIEIEGCTIVNWGMYGILAQYVRGFEICTTHVQNINYGGIMGLSVLDGVIELNRIANVIGSPNAYGIALTRLTTNPLELTSDPLSANCSIRRNRISNVTNWEGIDTHAGQNISICNNMITGCNRAIAVVPCPNSAAVVTYAPAGCLVKGNHMDSGVTDGSAIYGITVAGAGNTISQTSGLAANCIVEDNQIIGYGQQNAQLGMAVYFVATQSLRCRRNRVLQPGRAGIGLYYANYDFEVHNNEIVDPWCSANTSIYINVISDYNKGRIGSNKFLRGTLTGPDVGLLGLNVGNQPHNYVYYVPGYSDAATKVAGTTFGTY